MHQTAPQYDEFLDVHLTEHVAKHLDRWRGCQRGEVLNVGTTIPATARQH
jgi:hypothetical protein